MANTISQIGAVTGMNLRNIPAALGFLARGGGRHRRVSRWCWSRCCRSRRVSRRRWSFPARTTSPIIMRAGSTNEMSRAVSAGRGHHHQRRAGHQARCERASRQVSAELYVLTEAQVRGKDSEHQPAVPRRVGQMAPALRKTFQDREGRMMREGTNEILVGDGVVMQNTKGIDVGKKVRWGNARLDRGRARSATTVASRSPKPGRMRVWCSRSGSAATSFQSVRAQLTDDRRLRSRNSRTR